MALTRKRPVQDPPELNQLRVQLRDQQAEITALSAQLEGDPQSATWWLQSKVWRQRRALDRLERRNLSLRFALRIMNELRVPVTADEWKAARDAARLKDRLDEEKPS